MPEGLKVIALISGGKDSFFSILHCLANGHEIVALANLYPQSNGRLAEHSTSSISGTFNHASEEYGENQYSEVDDVESHMYQTIGHAVIPLYASALNLPVYRQPICGHAVTKSKTYHPPNGSSAPTRVPALRETDLVAGTESSAQDETESLIPLLQRIKSFHPGANAVSTGAILSTYQRTRIESVAARLDLVSLAYLWQYPLLPPYKQSSLLRDMSAIGMDARIVKVASGGLDSSILWENVTDPAVIRRLAKATQRFTGSEGVQLGAVLGEGGEFETLALDGPNILFARRIMVDETSKCVVLGEGGTAFVRIRDARAVEKACTLQDNRDDGDKLEQLRRPCLWDQEFASLLSTLGNYKPDERYGDTLYVKTDSEKLGNSQTAPGMSFSVSSRAIPLTVTSMASNIHISNATAVLPTLSNSTSGSQTASIISALRSTLSAEDLSPADISFTAVFLRSMASFAEVNAVYSSLFHLPNPPARVTVAVGDLLPSGLDVMMSFTIRRQPNGSLSQSVDEKGTRRLAEALHVQSRSYWAPANIGPYSQAVAVPIESRKRYSSNDGFDEDQEQRGDEQPSFVHVAGQIPLIPANMVLLDSSNFCDHAVLSLQHLWRVGRAMRVTWWGGGAVAFVTATSEIEARQRAILSGKIWTEMHKKLETGGESGDDEVDMDVGDVALYRPWAPNSGFGGARSEADADKSYRSPLPNWNDVHDGQSHAALQDVPPAPSLFAVEVSELPRGAQVEWWSFGFSGKSQILRTLAGEQVETCIAGSISVTWYQCTTVEILQELLEGTKAENQKPNEADRDASEFFEVFSPHPLEARVVSKSGAMIIPCKSVWDSSGRKLLAAVRATRQIR